MKMKNCRKALVMKMIHKLYNGGKLKRPNLKDNKQYNLIN